MDSGWKWKTSSSTYFVSSGVGLSRSTHRKRLVSVRRVGIKNISMFLLCNRPCVVSTSERIMQQPSRQLVCQAGTQVRHEWLEGKFVVPDWPRLRLCACQRVRSNPEVSILLHRQEIWSWHLVKRAEYAAVSSGLRSAEVQAVRAPEPDSLKAGCKVGRCESCFVPPRELVPQQAIIVNRHRNFPLQPPWMPGSEKPRRAAAQEEPGIRGGCRGKSR